MTARSAGRLEGRTVVVTGAARGMGAAHCEVLAAEGAYVVATDIDGAVMATAQRVGAAGGSATGVVHDVASSDSWASLVADVVAQRGTIDVLVNNAGVLDMRDAVDIEESAYERVVAVNQRGTFLGLRHVVPVMRRAGGGSIINVSSVYGLVGTAGYLAYCASKGAVTLMTKSAAVTHGPDGVRVNSVHPGVVFTEMLEQELAGLGPDSLDAFLQATPLRRGARPDEVSGCVLFLASDDSSFVTGAEIVVDGGLMAGR
ncbi:glucose 1-dehydrogenase [Nocardioides sp. C4-1]|uniref:SDR family NAD(P)-dependent oxidoreductase n=1 Tax=Nocardioides sp. C4-1 TaxID=3151851 RepID=UPI003267B6C2